MNVCPGCGMSLVCGVHRDGCDLTNVLPATDPDPNDTAIREFGYALGEIISDRATAAINNDLQMTGYAPGTAEWRFTEQAARVGVGIGASIMLQILTEQKWLNDEVLDEILSFYGPDEAE